MRAQIIEALHSANAAKAQRAATIARIAVGVLCSTVLLIDPAAAQSLKESGVAIFTKIYGLVGILGGTAVLFSLLNWATGNWLGRDDPKKTFFQALLATGLAFGTVGILQFVKETVGADASGIANL